VNFANYADFRTKLLIAIDGDDISQSSISAAVLDLIIASGEQRIYKDVRSSTQDAALSLSTTGNVAGLPTDCIELKNVYSPSFPSLTYAPYEVLQTLIQRGNSGSHAVRYTLQGDSMLFYPPVGDGTQILGRYYKRLADISTGLNAFFTRHSDLFFYGSLAESAPYIGEQSRLPLWTQRYLSLAQSVNEYERRRASRGSKLATRVS